MRFGGSERGVQARRVHGPVDHGRRRARGRERSPRDGRQSLGRGLVEPALEREDIPVQPGQQVQPGAEAGVRQLGQVRVEVHHAGQQDPGPQVDGCGGIVGSLAGGAREGDPPLGIHDQEPVSLVARAPGSQRRQQSGAQRERPARRQGRGRGRHGNLA